MSTLYITELASLGADALGSGILAPLVPSIAEQAVAIGGATAPSAPFQASTRFVMLATDTTCCLGWAPAGTVPAAVLGAHRMAANETRFYAVRAGMQVAVIAST